MLRLTGRCFDLRCNHRPSVIATIRSSDPLCQSPSARSCVEIPQHLFLFDWEDRNGVCAEEKDDAVCNDDLTGDPAHKELPAWASAQEGEVAGCPVYDFCDRSRQVVEYTDYTRISPA